MPSIPDNSLLLGDRYFPSFFFLADLRRRGIHGVFPAHAARNVDFRKGKWLSYGDHAVTWEKPPRPEWMSKEEYAGYPSTLDMREMEVREKGNGRERLVLVTTLLDAAAFPKADVAKMYRQRWKIEVALRDVKDTFGLDHINANTPAMIEKIIWAHALAYNLLRWHMLNACSLYEVEPEHVSVKTAARIVTANASHILSSTPEDRPRLFSSLYKQMVQAVVGRRPGREEPRAIKRRPKPRALLKESRKSWHERRKA
jgi:Transposase DDE domain